MLTILRSPMGPIQVACDWWLVDDHGWWEPKGKYVFINQLERTPGVNLHQVRHYLVDEIGRLAPDAVGVYWNRDDNVIQRQHGFKRSQLQQLRQEVMV